MTANRTIEVPAELSFKQGRGDARIVTVYPTANMGDEALLALLAYGTRLLNDTKNGSKKEDWAMLSGPALVRTFLDWLASPRVRTSSASAVPPAMIQAIKEYLSAKRKIPVWKKVEKERFPGKIPQPRDLHALLEYLTILNSPKGFTEEKWLVVYKGISDNAQAIEARRAELAEEDGEADLLL